MVKKISKKCVAVISAIAIMLVSVVTAATVYLTKADDNDDAFVTTPMGGLGYYDDGYYYDTWYSDETYSYYDDGYSEDYCDYYVEEVSTETEFVWSNSAWMDVVSTDGTFYWVMAGDGDSLWSLCNNDARVVEKFPAKNADIFDGTIYPNWYYRIPYVSDEVPGGGITWSAEEETYDSYDPWPAASDVPCVPKPSYSEYGGIQYMMSREQLMECYPNVNFTEIDPMNGRVSVRVAKQSSISPSSQGNVEKCIEDIDYYGLTIAPWSDWSWNTTPLDSGNMSIGERTTFYPESGGLDSNGIPTSMPGAGGCMVCTGTMQATRALLTMILGYSPMVYKIDYLDHAASVDYAVNGDEATYSYGSADLWVHNPTPYNIYVTGYVNGWGDIVVTAQII